MSEPGPVPLWADDFDFEDPFERTTDPAMAADLSAELVRELAPGHPLHGHEWTVIARAYDQDDVIVHDGRTVALVHLTCSGKPEVPPFPMASVIRSADEFHELLRYR